MVGVSSRIAGTRSDGSIRIQMAGYILGSWIAQGLLFVVILLAGSTLRRLAPPSLLGGGFILLTLGLVTSELLSRRPQWRRQTPQRYIWDLKPFPRGFAWGFDIGLWFTTYKASSLVWIVLGCSILSGDPAIEGFALASMNLGLLSAILWLAIRSDAAIADVSQQVRFDLARLGKWAPASQAALALASAAILAAGIGSGWT